MDLEEELEQVAIRRLVGVEGDLDRLGVGPVVAIGGVGHVAAGVTDAGRQHSGALADQVLHAPEAAAGQDRLFGAFTHLDYLLGVVGFREDLRVLPVALGLELFVGHEAQRGRVDAVPQATLVCRPVVEDVAEVAVAVTRTDFGADHAEARVGLLHDVRGLERNGEAGPPATAVELLGGGEQRFPRDDVDVDARLFLVPELVVERRFGGRFLGHRVLARVELGDRLGVLAVIARHLGLTRWRSHP